MSVNQANLEANQNEENGANAENVPLMNRPPSRYPHIDHRIFFIVKNGEIQQLKDILNSFVNKNKPGNENPPQLDPRLLEDETGKTPLHHACNHDDPEIANYMVDILLKCHFSDEEERSYFIHYKDKRDENAMHFAAEKNYWEIVKILADYRSDIFYPRLKHPIFCAVENGEITRLKEILKSFATANGRHRDPRLFEDKTGKTPLHHACSYGDNSIAKRMVEILLQWSFSPDLFNNKEERKKFVRYEDNGKKKALHVAADKGYWDIVLLLISYGGKLVGKEDLPLFKKLFAVYPNPHENVYETQLDRSVICSKGNPNHAKLTVAIDFESLTENNRITLSNIPKESSYLYELVRLLGEKNSEKFMLHPTVLTFLRLKLAKMKWLVFLSFLFHMIWLGTSTTFLARLYIYQCPFDILSNGTEERKNNDSSNSTNSTPSFIPENQCIIDYSDYALAIIVLLITIAVAVFEGFEFASEYRLKTPKLKNIYNYLKQKENIGQWILIVALSLTMPFFGTSLWQYYPAAVAIILSWTLILSQFRKIWIWDLGLYVEMISNVFNHFLRLMITFLPLLIGFSFGFKMLIPEKFGTEHFFLVLIKMFVMMTGEIGYSEIFGYNANTDAAAKLITFIFVAVVTLILLNLIIGLTVSEIQDVKKNAVMHNSLNQLGIIYHLENFIFSKLVQRILRSLIQPESMHSILVTEKCIRVRREEGNLVPVEKCDRARGDLFYFVSKPVLVSVKDLPSEFQPEIKALAEKNYICDEATMDALNEQQ